MGPDELIGAAATGSSTGPLIAGLVHLDADTVAAAAVDGTVAAASIEGLAPAAAPSPAGSLEPVQSQVRGWRIGFRLGGCGLAAHSLATLTRAAIRKTDAQLTIPALSSSSMASQCARSP